MNYLKYTRLVFKKKISFKELLFRLVFNIAPFLLKRYPGYAFAIEKKKQQQAPINSRLEEDRRRKIRKILYSHSRFEISNQSSESNHFLYVSHSLGGGIKNHIQTLKKLLENALRF